MWRGINSVFTKHRLKLRFSVGSLIVLGFLLGCQQGSKEVLPAWHGMDLTQGLSDDSVQSWSLPSTRLEHDRVSLKAFKGQSVLLFFGYAQCPDVCPTTLATLARVRKHLGKEADRLQVLFITVDPERDTLPFLKQYVTQFDPSFIALRGTLDETRQVAERFKIFFQKNPVTGGGYTVDHSSGVFLIDARGQVRALMSNTQPEDQVREDIQHLLRLTS